MGLSKSFPPSATLVSAPPLPPPCPHGSLFPPLLSIAGFEFWLSFGEFAFRSPVLTLTQNLILPLRTGSAAEFRTYVGVAPLPASPPNFFPINHCLRCRPLFPLLSPRFAVPGNIISQPLQVFFCRWTYPHASPQYPFPPFHCSQAFEQR